MKAIVTKQNADGSFDEVGMSNRALFSHYKTKQGLLRYGVFPFAKDHTCRVEIYYGDNIHRGPNEVFYVKHDCCYAIAPVK